MKNIAFIINPVSGSKESQNAKKKLPKLIMQTLDAEQWLPNIVFTERPGHATEMAYQFSRMGFDAVVAVGGDGTVNEVAQGLVKANGLMANGESLRANGLMANGESLMANGLMANGECLRANGRMANGECLKANGERSTALGIIPMGSGNGFARHLNIPIRPQKALELINRSEPISVDYGLANGRMFVSTCGTGFDALIADHFAGSNKRGFATYFQNILKDVFSYTPQTYHIVGDGLDVTHKAFLITFANANQWGYEALIAPKASVQDGKMDIMLMSSHAILGSASLALRLFAGSIDDSHFMDTIRAKEVTLEREEAAPFHIDGDPVHMEKDIHIRIVSDGLKVLVEKRF